MGLERDFGGWPGSLGRGRRRGLDGRTSTVDRRPSRGGAGAAAGASTVDRRPSNVDRRSSTVKGRSRGRGRGLDDRPSTVDRRPSRGRAGVHSDRSFCEWTHHERASPGEWIEISCSDSSGKNSVLRQHAAVQMTSAKNDHICRIIRSFTVDTTRHDSTRLDTIRHVFASCFLV